MANARYVSCPACTGRFLVGPEFFVLVESECHCPYCHAAFSVCTAADVGGAGPTAP